MTHPAGLNAPLTEAQTKEVIDNFYREGFALVPGVLGADEVAFLRRRTDELAADETVYRDGCVIRHPQERDLALSGSRFFPW